MGDIPYSSSEFTTLQQQIADHNRYSPSDFVIHIGDIKAGTSSCPEANYQNVSNLLKTLKVPTYIIPGDNEWNDCSNPDQAWIYWTQYFNDFELSFCNPPTTQRQGIRHENFAFVSKGVLFVGINLVGGSVHSSSEWNTRMQQDADWVSQQFQTHVGQVRAAVIFGHAGPGNSHHDLFFNQFRTAAATFAKPILYLHGDGHTWKSDNPFPEQNVHRIEVENGSAEDPVQITVGMASSDPWQIQRDPWSGSPAVVNKAPCAQAGPDLAITLPGAATLAGVATDDGDPAPPTLTLQWSKMSGPGTVTFANPNVAATTATIGSAGTYVLRLTANDGQLQTSDDMTIVATGGGPALSINDITVTETDSGTLDAVFTVSLAGGTGASVSVQFATAGNSATPGSDYTTTSGTLNFSGSTVEGTITVPVHGDLLYEGTESFFVELSDASGASVVDAQGVGTILDDEPPPSPAITTFTPDTGPPGTSVAVSGSNFIGVTGVTFNGVAAAFGVDSPTQLHATVPATATTGPIAVTTAGGSAQGATDFVVVIPPPETSFTPTHDTQAYSGSPTSNYGAVASVRIRATLYQSYFKFDLTGIGAVQSAKLRLFCTDDSPSGGALYAVSNNYLGTGTPWVESGLNWNNAPAIGGTPVAPDQPAVDNTWLEWDVTSAIGGSGTYSFALQSTSSDNNAIYSSKEAGSNRPVLVVVASTGPVLPVVGSFAPASGVAGAEVTVAGSGFVEVTDVAFNGTAAGFTVDSPSQLRATVPAGASTGRIAVTNEDGTGQSTGDFVVILPPGITSFTPASGPAGTEVTVTGSNLTGVSQVTFNGTAAISVTTVSPTELRATVPGGATTGRVAVTNPAGSAQSTTDFTITAPPPTSSVAPLHDAQTNSANPTTNYGTLASLRVKTATYHSYLKFDLSGLTQPPASAKLRLFCIDDSPSSGAVYLVSNDYAGTASSWLESGLDWNNAPAIGATPVAPAQAAGSNVWVEFDVTSAITGGGIYSFALQSTNTNSAIFNSKEAATNRPVLMIEAGNEPPSPMVTSFAPGSGAPGTEVTITGSNFAGVTGVTFNDLAAASFAVDSPTELRATVPAGATTGRIAVTNGDGTGQSATDFVVPTPPIVTSFTPASGPAGTEVTVSGGNFVGVSAVTFNGVAAASFTVDSPTSLRATVPAGATSGEIAVTNGDGTTQSVLDFTVTFPPIIASFTPSSGLGGTEVAITGSNFAGVTGVTFNGLAAASFAVDSPTELRATVPAGATTGRIAVTNGDGTGQSATDFVVPTPPIVTSFTPASGPAGTEVTVSGGNFVGVSAVTFNGVAAASYVVDSANQLRAIVSSGATSGKVAVTNADGTTQSATDFTVTFPPIVGSFLPGSGPFGTEVTIAGGNFAGVTAVTFNGVAATGFAVDSPSQLRATVPAGAATGRIAITNADGTAQSATDFTITFPPIVASCTPTSGPAGTEVTVGGEHFVGVIAVTFNGVAAASFAVDSPGELRAVVPSGATTGKVAVTNSDGTGQSTTDFTVTFPPDISSFTPGSGPFGTEVTIAGGNFVGVTAVTFNSLAAASFVVDSPNQLRATVPDGASTGRIAVTNADGTAESATDFTVTFPPIIASFTPSSGLAGVEVTISGSNFTGVTGVTFNGLAAAGFAVDSPTELRSTVPAGASSGRIAVTNADGTGQSASDFVVPAPPIVTSFTPTSGPYGTEVTITGGSFTGVTGVTFNGLAAASFAVDSPSQLRAAVPGGASTGRIAVTNAYGTTQSATDFTVTFPPIIASFTPTSGLAGTEVMITGSNFVGVTAVAFHGVVAASFVVDGPGQLRAIVPSGATTGRITITGSGGMGESTTDFQIPTPPNVTSFTPLTGPVGSEVTVSGSNFVGVTAVTFNGLAASYTVDSPGQLRATVPAGAATGKIAVTNSDGAGQSGMSFTVTTPPALASFASAHDAHVNSGSPTSNYGAITTLRVRTGVYRTYLKFDLTSVTTVLSAKLRLFCTDASPDGGAVHAVSNDYLGTSTPWVESGINWNNAPAATGSPAAPAQAVTVGTWVEYDVSSAIASGGIYSFALQSNNTNNAIYNSDEATANRPVLVIEHSAGPPPPSIASFSPGSGTIGTQVTLTGAHYVGVTAVTFSGVLADFIVNSPTQLRALVPPGASTGRIAVISPDGVGQSGTDFVVVVPPSITSFTPGSGPPGTEVTVTGAGFGGITSVTFNGVAATTFTVDSPAQLRATVPAGATSGPIAVANLAGSAQSATDFTVTAPPSIVNLAAIHDAYTSANSPAANFGTASTLRVKSAAFRTYLKFDLSAVALPVLSAKLRLFCTDASPSGGAVYLVSNDYGTTATPWLESGINWNNAPVIGGAPAAPSQAVVKNVWVEYDVTSAIAAAGITSFALQSTSTNVAVYASAEGANPPVLVVTSAGAARVEEIHAQTGPESDLTGAVAPARLTMRTYPNPARGWARFEYHAAASGELRLTVFDVAGRRVRSLSRAVTRGTGHLEWDGRDAGGHAVGPGLYFYRAELDAERLKGKLLLAR